MHMHKYLFLLYEYKGDDSYLQKMRKETKEVEMHD